MSIGPIIVSSAVIGALVVFAVVLAWGDYRAQSRDEFVNAIMHR
jgi:hypothetical protein